MSGDVTGVLLGALRLAAVVTSALFLPTLLQFLLLLVAGRFLLYLVSRAAPAVQDLLGLVGVPVHEFSHAIAALVTFGRVVAITPLLDKTGQATTLVQTNWLGRVIVPVAPLLGGICMLWLTGSYVIPGFQVYSLLPPHIDAGAASFGQVFSASLDYLGRFLSAVYGHLPSLSWGNWRTYAGLYIALSVGIAIAPSSTDLRLLAKGVPPLLVLFCCFFLALYLVGGDENSLSTVRQALALSMLRLSTAISAAFLLSSIGAVLLLPLALWGKWRSA